MSSVFHIYHKSLYDKFKSVICLIRFRPNCKFFFDFFTSKNGQSDEARMHGRKLEQLEIQIEGVHKSYDDCYKAHVKHFNTDKERLRAKQHVILHANIICTTLNSCRSREMENLFLT